MLNIGIIGCGTIADAHADSIQWTPGAKLVAVCDAEVLMAKQMAERFDAGQYFTDPKEMLKRCRLDAVHITTPPQSHYDLGKLCISRGCHVYVEKPFTVDTREAVDLLAFAKGNGVKVTVGHNLQFSHASIRLRNLVASGYLGGKPVHMESIYCYDFGDERYARAMLGDKNHWVRKLPGNLLQNIINHGVCRIAEYIETDKPTISSIGSISPLLRSIGENEINDELRVIVHDNDNTTGYFTFSSQMSPKRRQFRVYGTQNAVFLDDDLQTVVKYRGKKLKSYLDHFVSPWIIAKEHAVNSFYNMWKFVTNDFHVNHGMRNLIRAFYRSIVDDTPPPIPYREIILTTHIMEEIFNQVSTRLDGAVTLSD